MSASSLAGEMSFGKATGCCVDSFTPKKIRNREKYHDMVDENVKRDELGAIDYAFYLKESKMHRSDAICSLFSGVLRFFKK